MPIIRPVCRRLLLITRYMFILSAVCKASCTSIIPFLYLSSLYTPACILRAFQQRWIALQYIYNLCVFPLSDAQFVRVAPLSETDNQEDDKVYVFFTERAQEAEGASGKVLYSRVARVCKVRSKFVQER